VKQELPTLPEHLSCAPFFSGVPVTRSFILCVMFCRSLFVLFLLALMLSVLPISYEACVHRTSLTPPLFNEVPVPNAVCHESERLCICILSVTILPFSTIFRFECWNCSDSMVIFMCNVL
jgi:hypothetical protein